MAQSLTDLICIVSPVPDSEEAVGRGWYGGKQTIGSPFHFFSALTLPVMPIITQCCCSSSRIFGLPCLISLSLRSSASPLLTGQSKGKSFHPTSPASNLMFKIYDLILTLLQLPDLPTCMGLPKLQVCIWGPGNCPISDGSLNEWVAASFSKLNQKIILVWSVENPTGLPAIHISHWAVNVQNWSWFWQAPKGMQKHCLRCNLLNCPGLGQILPQQLH